MSALLCIVVPLMACGVKNTSSLGAIRTTSPVGSAVNNTLRQDCNQYLVLHTVLLQPALNHLPNYTVYVLDPGDRRLLHMGVRGEIFIAGPGVTAGYLNNDALTREIFVPSHLVTADDVARGWTTLHRTGDLGRWRTDGSLVIEGRVRYPGQGAWSADRPPGDRDGHQTEERR